MGTLSHGVIGMVLLAMGAIVVPAAAQDAPVIYTVHLHAGTCERSDEVAAALTELTDAADAQVGAAAATPAFSSFSSVPLALDALLAEPYAIDIHRSPDDLVIACGELGGVPDGNGALAVGLRPANISGFSGIAYLSPLASDPSQTGISTFLAETGVAAGAAGQPADAASYTAAVRAQVTLIIGSLQRVDALFDAPRLDDQVWVNQVVAELTLWQIVYGEAQDLVPPPEFADFHGRYAEALALLDSAAQDITEGFDSGDQARLTQANTKIDQAIEALRALDTANGPATPAPATPAT